MRTSGKDLKRSREQRLQKAAKDPVAEGTTYSGFKNAMRKRLAARVPVASSPLVTRWQQRHAGGGAGAPGASRLVSDPATTAVTSQVPKELSCIKTVVTLASRHAAAGLEGRSIRRAGMEKKQKCPSQLPVVQDVGYSIAERGDMKVCENTNCTWRGCRGGNQNEFRAVTEMKLSVPMELEVRLHITGLRNDYYLNILDWSLENLIAIAVGPAAHIWNGGTLQAIGSIDLNSSSKYISSLAWITEGTCLAIGTSDGEVQLWDIETKKRLRNMFGHLSVVGALSWNHYILSSGSRLGSIHHHDVRVAQHHVGTLCQNKQSICSLKWSLANQLLASGSSDGILNIWPSDPGVKLQSQPLKTIPHSSAVKAMNWCPWQSKVLATGGGMKDGILRVWDINREKIIQSAATDSQICSLLWLPKSSKLMTGHGLPGHQMKIWKYPILVNSSELHGHKGRVLHTALSPDQSRLFSVAADGTSCLWRCHAPGESKHSNKAFSEDLPADDSDIDLPQGIKKPFSDDCEFSPSCYCACRSWFGGHLSDLGSQNLNVTYDCDKEPDKSNVSTRTRSPDGIPQGWHSCCTAGSGLNISEIRVVLGAHQASMAEKEQQVFKVMECFPNTQFGSSSKENDTMLLKLNGIAKLSEYTQLLPFLESGKDIKPGTMCIPGWESHLE